MKCSRATRSGVLSARANPVAISNSEAASTERKLQYYTRCSAGADQPIDERHVRRLRRVHGHPLAARPGVVLRATLEVEHARPRALHVAERSLLVERVKLEQNIGRGSLRERLGALLSLFESIVHCGNLT